MKSVSVQQKEGAPIVALVQEKLTRQCGLLLRAGGADGIRGKAAGGAVRGVETCDGGLAEEGGRATEPTEFKRPFVDRLGGAILPRGSVLTSTGRAFLLTSRAKRSRLRTVPRGTPKPAEPGVIVTRCGNPDAGFTVRPLPTMTVPRPRTGGATTAVRRGGFTTRGTAYQVFQYPGCHTQPKPGTKAQLP